MIVAPRDVKAVIRNVLGWMHKSSLCIEFRPACVFVLASEFRFLEILGELGVAAGFSMHD